jgi:integrase
MSRRNQGPKLRWLTERRRWYIAWTEQGRSRKRSTGTVNRAQAEAILGEWLRTRGHAQGPCDPSQVLVTDVLADYASERGPRVAAPRVQALIPFWQGRSVADVTPRTCALYADARTRSTNTVCRELNVLRTAINYAHKNGRITRLVYVELPRKPPARTRWLTRKEVAILLQAALRNAKVRLYLPLFILMAVYTGRRKEALLSLRWCQVDLEAGLIDFEGSGLRTNKRRGKIRIPKRLLQHLHRARRRGTAMGYVLHINGERIGDVKKGLAAAATRARLQGVTPHVFRHTAATWLMQNGTQTWEAAQFLAMSEKMLNEVYGHHHPEFEKHAAENITRRPSVSKMGA